MNYILLYSLNFSIFLFSLIVLFDITIKLRISSYISLCFYLIVFPVFLSSGVSFFKLNHSTFYNILQFNKISSFIGMLFLFNILSIKTQIRKIIQIFSIILIILFSLRVGFTFNNQTILIANPTNSYFYFEIQPIKLYNKLPNLFRFLRVILITFSFSLFIYLWVSIIRNSDSQNLYSRKVKIFVNSFLIYLIIILSIFVARIYYPFLFSFKINYIISFLLQLYILLVVLYRPYYLNQISSSKIAITSAFGLKSNSIDSDKFDKTFSFSAAYLDSSITLAKYAALNDFDKNDLSLYIVNRFGLTFDELVNKNRIDYFVLLSKRPDCKNYTIEALSRECGFVSRNSFYKPFKRFHGGNPSDLINLYLKES